MIIKTKLNKLLRFTPAIVWMLFIYYLSSGPTTLIKGTPVERFLILKSFHLIEYAILSITVFYALNSPLKSIIFSYLYSLTDELHQAFIPGRSARFWDTLIDLVGIIIGLLVYQLIKKTLPHVRSGFLCGKLKLVK